MDLITKKPVGCNVTGFKKHIDHRNYSRHSANSKKQMVGYFSELLSWPHQDPIIISVDWICVNYLRKRHGLCLLANENAEFYDLNYCYEKTVWVFHAKEDDFLKADILKQACLRFGAVEVNVFLFNPEMLKVYQFSDAVMRCLNGN